MLDPFFPPPQILVNAIQPMANYIGLLTLPLHVHEIIFAWVFYHLVCTIISPAISNWLFPSTYVQLPARTMRNWDVHVTSFIQSSFITVFALLVIWTDEERKEMDWVGRIWGYTGAGGAVQGFAAGYFLWDLIVSTVHLKVLGWGSLVHAISALLVTSLGFHPFANYYGLNFILYEISTPFLNIHWFFDKLHMTGSEFQFYNGVALLATFFGGRVLWGNYQSFRIYSDVWTALHSPSPSPQHVNDNYKFAYRKIAGWDLKTFEGFGDMRLPMWLVFIYLGSNTILNVLNMYWFAKMIHALRKRFQTPDTALTKARISSEKDFGDVG